MREIEIPVIERKDNVSIAKNDTNASSSIIPIYETISTNSLYDKYVNNKEFTREDLIVLYDIYHYRLDMNEEDIKRLFKVKINRLYIEDMCKIFECSVKNIALDKNTLNMNPESYVILIGDYNLHESTSIDYKYPNLRYISCNLDIYKVKNYDNNFPSLEVIGGKSWIDSPTANGFENLKSFGMGIYWNNLEDATHLTNLEIIGGQAGFPDLENAQGLNNLKYVYGDANFNKLVSSKGLENLRMIDGEADFQKLQDIDYFNSLESLPNGWMRNDLNTELKKKIRVKGK